MFAKMADAVMKHSKVVIAIWLVIVLCSVPFMLKTDSVLEYDLTSMTGSDSESAQGNAIMEENFSNAINMNEVLVVSYTTGQETQVNALAEQISTIFG
ncbi:MAG: MMPL family transporter, partial [archaeon]|nr:MMPL family transporter [archaeon]